MGNDTGTCNDTVTAAGLNAGSLSDESADGVLLAVEHDDRLGLDAANDRCAGHQVVECHRCGVGHQPERATHEAVIQNDLVLAIAAKDAGRSVDGLDEPIRLDSLSIKRRQWDAVLLRERTFATDSENDQE